MSLIPTQPKSAERVNPKKLIIYSKPKVGKTEALLQLEDSILIDLEGGSEFFSGMYINVLKEARELKQSPLQVMKNIQDELKKSRSFKRIIIDTITVLEDLTLPYAKSLYVSTPQGSTFKGDNVLHLPNGAGYMWTREAFFKVLKGFEECADEIIYVGHLKATLINKNGEETSAKDLDLTGKMKQMLCADVDGIGILIRDENKCYLSFETSDEIICGARPSHLKNKKILLSEMTDKGLKTYWNNVFLPSK